MNDWRIEILSTHRPNWSFKDRTARSCPIISSNRMNVRIHSSTENYLCFPPTCFTLVAPMICSKIANHGCGSSCCLTLLNFVFVLMIFYPQSQPLLILAIPTTYWFLSSTSASSEAKYSVILWLPCLGFSLTDVGIIWSPLGSQLLTPIGALIVVT